MGDTWRDVPGYEGHYMINSLGDIKSLKGKSEKILKKKMQDRYPAVTLSLNNNLKTWRIHQLMAMAFLNHKPCGYDMVVDHIDGDKKNNNIKNLRVISQRENSYNYFKSAPSKSKYVGVSPNPYGVHSKKWKASMTYNGETFHLGNYDTEEEASDVYNKAVELISKGESIECLRKKKPLPTSKYPGVYWNSSRSWWQCQIKINGKNYPLGVFDEEESAHNLFKKASLIRDELKQNKLSLKDAELEIEKLKRSKPNIN